MTAARHIDVHHHILPDFYLAEARAAGLGTYAESPLPDWTPDGVGKAGVPARPRWDPGERNLYFGDVLLLHLRHRAPALEPILDAFQAAEWAESIDVPPEWQREPDWAECINTSFLPA